MLKPRVNSVLLSKPMNIHIAGMEQVQAVDLKDCNNVPIMKDDEFQEAHLQAALLKKTAVPVPDVIEIDTGLYEKMYQANVTMPKRLIRVFDESDIFCDYDMDASDSCWLANWIQDEQPSNCNLTVEKFEKSIECLEKNSETKVPTFDILVSQKITKNRYEAEACFDYWLDKRLKTREKLIPQIKFKDQKTLKKGDPYVVFRLQVEKMKTRKNRAADIKSYFRLLQIRSGLQDDVNKLREGANDLKQRRNLLVQKIVEFQAQYRSASYNDEFLHWIYCSQSGIEGDETEDSCKDEREAKQSEDFEFPFHRKAACEYLKPVESNVQDDDKDFIQTSPNKFLRKRIGRGGRIVFDRRTEISDYKKSGFRRVNINPAVKCFKLSHFPVNQSTSSVFNVKNTSVDEQDIEYQKIDFT